MISSHLFFYSANCLLSLLCVMKSFFLINELLIINSITSLLNVIHPINHLNTIMTFSLSSVILWDMIEINSCAQWGSTVIIIWWIYWHKFDRLHETSNLKRKSILTRINFLFSELFFDYRNIIFICQIFSDMFYSSLHD